MTDDQLELVTAYLDGEATADERALVEADPELLAEVEHQRAVRAALHDVEPPAAAARESAIAAALAVFDDEFAPTAAAAGSAARDVTAPTNIVPFEQRRRMRWMQSVGAAAAVAAVVVAGAVIATRGGGDDAGTADQLRDSTVVELDSDSIEQGDAAAQPPAAEGVATTSGAEPMIADTLGAAAEEAPTEGEYNADAVATSEPEPLTAAPAAPAPTTAPTAAAAPATTAAARMVVVRTEDDLLDLADTIKTTPLDLDDAESACADDALKAEAMLEDDDGAEHPIVVVAIDDDTIGALTLDDCDVVLEADP